MSYIKNANCFDEFLNINNECVDLVLVDLPYGQTACAWDSVIDLKKMWVELKRICKEGCVYVFFCTTKFGNTLINSNPSWFRYDLVWEKSRTVGFLCATKMPLRKHEMIYIFSYSGGDDLENKRNLGLREYAGKIKTYINTPIKEIDKAVGNQGCRHFYLFKTTQFGLPTEKTYNKLIEHYKINEMKEFKEYKQLKSEWETNPSTYNPQKTKGKPWKVKAGATRNIGESYGQTILPLYGNKTGDRHPTSILKFNNPPKPIHPTQKPLLLCEWIVKTYSNEGDMVLDFCMGSGSTVAACINTCRRYVGIEKDLKIFNTAKNRLGV